MFSNAPVIISGGSFTNVSNTGVFPVDHGEVIDRYFTNYIAPDATHDTNGLENPPVCHPGTRTTILQRLVDWSRNADQASFITWIFGPAGVGKSALARSFAQLISAEGLLGASFFFFRTAPNRSTEKLLISTITYQLAYSFPELQPYIATAVKKNPLILQQSVATQLQKLIIEPFNSLPNHDTVTQRIIIIDGLDECEGRNAQRLILTSIGSAASQLSGKFKFLILSRPEHDIECTFDLPALKPVTLSVNLKKDLSALDDIRLFLDDKFDEIKKTHPLKSKIDPSWPGEEAIRTLVWKSSGNFIYPRTVMNYIETTYERPQKRLEVVLGLSPTSDSPFAELDDLYYHILSRVRTDRADLKKLLHDLLACHRGLQGLPLNSTPTFILTTAFIEAALSWESGDVEVKLTDLRSLITCEDKINPYMMVFPRFLHASFSDFLLDAARSKEYWVDLEKAYNDIAMGMVKFLDHKIPTMERTKCDCKLKQYHALCDHSCQLYYKALFWSALPNKELHSAIRDHDIGPSLNLLLRDDIEDELWADAATTLIYFLQRLERSTAFRGTDLFRLHLSKVDAFVNTLLDKYNHENNPLLQLLLALLGYAEESKIWLCIALTCLFHSVQGTSDPNERLKLEKAVAESIINDGLSISLLRAAQRKSNKGGQGSRPLNFLAKMIASLQSSSHVTSDKEEQFFSSKAHYPFSAPPRHVLWETSAKYLKRFLKDEKRSGRHYIDNNKVHHAIVYCRSCISPEPSDNPIPFALFASSDHDDPNALDKSFRTSFAYTINELHVSDHSFNYYHGPGKVPQ
ncbi:hypothetical protein GALMADRAFT_256676 [Galerina marginata CBS 339.88]|uniref:NACHT domain-containing protein n=1 Tax=Galerina marginata (strain CBS 339.88) TaxID=685588 RepID=A0A067SD13_GALM3|nr:hypothetical protein GALMADRAFT_256676 [Galerina marginata CBS 339.88]